VEFMRKVIYTTSLSLDGYIEEATGGSSWVVPDEELHRHFNSLEQDIDTHLYGRRMYELMAAYWPTADQNPSMLPYEIDYAHNWKAVQKVVFSKTIEAVGWNARIVRGDVVEEVARLKSLPGKNMSVGGLILASALATAGLIDEYQFYYVPILLGSGKAVFTELGQRVSLQLLETRAFKSGTVLIRCQPVSV
jgi:dihydrofolate reductase